MPILSTSSSRNSGLRTPTFDMFCRILPGIEPMYVRRWPRISASSRTPPRLMRTNLRPVALRDRLAERRLADAGRPDEAQDRAPSGWSTRCCTARYSTMRSLTFSRP